MKKLAIVLVALALAVGVACSSSGDKAADRSKLTKVSVMLDWTPNTNHAGMYLAKSMGLYKQAGLDVHFLQPGEGGDVAQAVATGSVDFGVSAAEQVVPARQAGIPVVSIAAIIQHNTSALVSLKDRGITRPRDLQGRTYGGFGGGFEKALIDELVRCDGGDPSKVKFVNVGDVDYRQGMQRKQYDVVWVFDGWDVIKIDQIDGTRLNRIAFADHLSCIPDWYTPVLITGEKQISQERDVVVRFLAATRKGYQQAMAHPDKAAESLIGQVPELDPALVQASAKFLATRYAAKPEEWGVQDPATWTRFVDFLTKHKIVKPGFDVSAAYDTTLLNAATK